jgi:hypothetical protein
MGRRSYVVAIDRQAVALDRFDRVGRRPHAFIGDRRIKWRQVDRPHRLRAEHEGIVRYAFAVDLRFQREIADAVEARVRIARYSAFQQVDGCEIARVLERAPQRDHAPFAAVIVLRRPVIAVACIEPAADRRQRDLLIAHHGVGLQAPLQGGEIGERLERRAWLAL